MKKSILFAIAASTIAVISLTTYESLTHAPHMDASSQSEKVLKHVASKSTSSMVKASQKAKTETSDQKQESHDQEVVASNAAQTTSNQAAETQVSSDTSVSTTTAPAAQPEQQATQPSAVAPAPAPTRTDGINFKGKHFDLQPFSGVNGEKTPSWTPYIFKWTALPNYYLAEEASAAGPATMSLSVGDEIVLDGRILHVSQVIPGMVRTQSMNLVTQLSAQHALGIQTCENPTGSIIRTVWAD